MKINNLTKIAAYLRTGTKAVYANGERIMRVRRGHNGLIWVTYLANGKAICFGSLGSINFEIK